MKQLNNTLNDGKLLFSSELIKAILYNIPIEDFINELGKRSVSSLSYEQVLSILKDTSYQLNVYQLKGHIESFQRSFGNSKISFYNVIFEFAEKMIYRKDNKFVFRYEYTDIWSNLSKKIDEEIIVSAAALLDAERRGYSYIPKIDWSYSIPSDNSEIQNLINRGEGTSENHFHLRGSSSYFYMSWIYLMNNIENPIFEERIRQIEKDRLTSSFSSIKNESLLLLYNKAAMIRLFLYSFINGDCPAFSDIFVEINDVSRDSRNYNFEIDKELLDSKQSISLEELQPYYLQNVDAYERFKQISVEKMFAWLVDNILPCDELYTLTSFRLQEKIDKYNDYLPEHIDYAQKDGNLSGKYYNLYGERIILLKSLKTILDKALGYEKVEDLLLIYLSIKNQFHSELVQNNGRIGFYNFKQYQDRKDDFLPWAPFIEEQLATDTVCSIIDDINVHKVELRISPCNSVKENAEQIQLYNKAINNAIQKCFPDCEDNSYRKPDLNDFFFTFHFGKIADTEHNDMICRNSKARLSADKKTEAIIQLRQNYQESAKRVFGIDACADEMKCRPEVFGSCFRRLQHYDISVNSNTNIELHQLKATYHVGEDNYDILDSLRAIDEALIFLDLRSGSRLGHATYLGIPADIYYDEKFRIVSMPKQVWLDNVVWLYFFIVNNNINFEGVSLLLSYLENQFNNVFYDIYHNKIGSEYVNYMLKHIPEKTYANKPIDKEHCRFNSYSYYLSWLLRGDEPSLYIKGYYEKPEFEHEQYKICVTVDKMNKARTYFEPTYLYYLYHYDKESKIEGEIQISQELPDYFIDGVLAVQNQMQKLIALKSISIETNPTSNLFISTMGGYEEHPISSFYNNGLIDEPGSVQLNVSVNTDDKSVFSTCLSNEYTYLLFYLENQVDSCGNKKYTRFQILDWLDNIRRMGNEQSFAN